eukprot:4290671-Prymnesium_polylepis.1
MSTQPAGRTRGGEESEAAGRRRERAAQARGQGRAAADVREDGGQQQRGRGAEEGPTHPRGGWFGVASR